MKNNEKQKTQHKEQNTTHTTQYERTSQELSAAYFTSETYELNRVRVRMKTAKERMTPQETRDGKTTKTTRHTHARTYRQYVKVSTIKSPQQENNGRLQWESELSFFHLLNIGP